MILPTKDELNEIAELIGGFKFDELPPENRVQCIDLAIRAKTNHLLDGIDTSLTHVSNWFEQSKLYWP